MVITSGPVCAVPQVNYIFFRTGEMVVSLSHSTCAITLYLLYLGVLMWQIDVVLVFCCRML